MDCFLFFRGLDRAGLRFLLHVIFGGWIILLVNLSLYGFYGSLALGLGHGFGGGKTKSGLVANSTAMICFTDLHSMKVWLGAC